MSVESRALQPLVRQLAHLKVLSRLMGHELHAQASSRTLTLSHNPQFKNSIKQIKDDVKAYRKSLSDNQELASTYAKDIVKIARRIEFASIYPPNALNEMQNAIVEFDDAQRSEQGGLRFIDIFLFPTGTIVASGDNCSEQGSGRWLPKPSDTFNKFVLMLKPSGGPMWWSRPALNGSPQYTYEVVVTALHVTMV